MNKPHDPSNLRPMLAGLARTARRAANAMMPPAVAMSAKSACASPRPQDKQARELGMRLQKSVESYAQLRRRLEALDQRATVPALLDVLLQDERQWASLRSKSDPAGLALMASMFEAVQHAYLLSLGVDVAPVNLSVELADGRLVVKEHVPNASPEWIPCWRPTLDSPDVSQTLVYADPRTAAVRVHITWHHANPVSLEPSTGWTQEAYPTGATASARRGTQFESRLLDPDVDGIVSLKLQLTAASSASKPLTRDLWISVSVGETADRPVVRPPTRITIPVSDPTPPFIPGDFFYSLSEDHQREIRDAMREFLGQNVRMYAELSADIGMPAALEADFLATALITAERG